MKPFDLGGKVALVTGASSGLGRHFAQVLARAGAKVALAARRVDRLEDAAAEIAAFDGRALPVALDVRDRASIEAAFDAAETELGPLAIVVNNAGIAASKPFLAESDAEWADIIATNLDGARRVAQVAAQRMARHGRGGSIVNVASILAFGVKAQLGAYAAAKAGLVSLTRTMAVELARDQIRVNALAPGYIATELNRDFLASEAGQAIVKRVPLRRFGQAADLDGALLLLASDAGRWMTGSVIVVDGGHGVGAL